MLEEFIKRRTLAKLGITISGDQIPAKLCDAFLVFERVLDDIQAEENKRRASKSQR